MTPSTYALVGVEGVEYEPLAAQDVVDGGAESSADKPEGELRSVLGVPQDVVPGSGVPAVADGGGHGRVGGRRTMR